MVTLQKSHFPIHQKFQFKIHNLCNVEIEIQIINVTTISPTIPNNAIKQHKTSQNTKICEGIRRVLFIHKNNEIFDEFWQQSQYLYFFLCNTSFY